MKVLLFGAKGFLGYNTATYLKNDNHSVVELTHKDVDITNYSNINQIAYEVDAVINCAAKVSTSNLDYESAFQVNTLGAANIMKWAINNKVKRFIHCSTLSVIRRPWIDLSENSTLDINGPGTSYAVSKLAGEQAISVVADNKISLATLRLSALYGNQMKWTGVIPKFIDIALAGGQLEAEKYSFADFLHINDASQCLIKAATTNVTGIINVASGIETSIMHLANVILSCAGRDERVKILLSNINENSKRADVNTSKMTKELKHINKISLKDGIHDMVQTRLKAI